MQPIEYALFNSVYVEYYPTLRVMAVRFGLPYSEVEDVIQETFISYFSHYPVDWEAKKMKAMLSKILKNKCIDFSRKKRTEYVSIESDLLSENSLLMKKLASKDSLSIIEESEERQKVWDALHSMRGDWQQVFVLYFIQDRPMKEVSAIMGITEEACRMRITRGRRYLKDTLVEA